MKKYNIMEDAESIVDQAFSKDPIHSPYEGMDYATMLALHLMKLRELIKKNREILGEEDY